MFMTRTRCLTLASVILIGAEAPLAQNAPPDLPVVTVRGQTYTPMSILARNMGEEDQTTGHMLIMNDTNWPLPTLDATRLLVRAALRRAVEAATT